MSPGRVDAFLSETDKSKMSVYVGLVVNKNIRAFPSPFYTGEVRDKTIQYTPETIQTLIDTVRGARFAAGVVHFR